MRQITAELNMVRNASGAQCLSAAWRASLMAHGMFGLAAPQSIHLMRSIQAVQRKFIIT